MSTRFLCPACGDEFTLPDELFGKKVRCATCGTGLVVDAGAGKPEALPAPPDESLAGHAVPVPPGEGPSVPRERRVVEPEPEPWSRLALGLVSAGAAGVLALVILAAGRIWWSWHPTRPAAPAAPVPRSVRDPNAIPEAALRVPNPPPGEDKVTWTVAADPLPRPVSPPADTSSAIPIGSEQVLYPSTPSPRCLIYPAAGSGGECRVIDVGTMKSVAFFPRGQAVGQPLALSPDGAYFIAEAAADAATRVVLSARDGKEVWRLGGRGEFVDFAGPGRVVCLASAVRVWEFPAGRLVHDLPLPDAGPRRAALSAGRNYLAVIGSRPSRLTIYDLTSGKRAGEADLTPFEKGSSYQCEAVCFSHDGREVAALFHAKSGSRVIAWNVAGGAVSVDHQFPADLRAVAGPGEDDRGRPLEWWPDGRGWLIYGNLLVDRTGYLLWRVGGARHAPQVGPSHVLDAGHVAVVSGRGADRALRILRVPQDQVQAARQAAEVDLRAGLPSPRPGDWSTGRAVPPSPTPVAWRVQADPAASPGPPLAKRPIRLGVEAGELRRILFSGPAAGRAAVVSAAASNPLARVQGVRVARVDLHAGRCEEGKRLFATEANLGDLRADLDPDGHSILIREPALGRRLDVWSLDGRHVAGWVPYENESAAADSVAWCAFGDGRRVFTANDAGRVVLWELPQCRAVYETGPYPGGWCLSPAKKYLAAWGGNGIDLVSAADGEVGGRLLPPADLKVDRCLAVAFRPDGEELVALLSVGSRVELVRWELKQGTLLGHFPLTDATPGLQWSGRRFLLQGDRLIDLVRRRAVSEYFLPGKGIHAQGSPDGRHWYAFSPGPDQPAVLTAQTVPEANVDSLPEKAVLTGDN